VHRSAINCHANEQLKIYSITRISSNCCIIRIITFKKSKKKK